MATYNELPQVTVANLHGEAPDKDVEAEMAKERMILIAVKSCRSFSVLKVQKIHSAP